MAFRIVRTNSTMELIDAILDANISTLLANAKTLIINLEEHDDHFHNVERWFGKRAPQTANNWADHASLAPYRAISGNIGQ